MERIAKLSSVGGRQAAISLIAVLALAACGESGRYGTGPGGGGGGGGGGGTGGSGGTGGAPFVQFLQPAAGTPVGVGDSVLIQFRVTDDRSVISVQIEGVAHRGDINFGTDTTVTRFASRSFSVNRPDTTLTRYVRTLLTDSTPEFGYIRVSATDSAGNRTTDSLRVQLTQGPSIAIIRPSQGASASVGRGVVIELFAQDPQGVRFLGYGVTGVLTASDTFFVPTIPPGVLPDTVRFIDTLVIPAGTPLGQMTITAFATDSTGDPANAAASIIVNVQSAASDNTAPLVTFSITSRIEVDDTITINATDPSGISRIGFIVRDPAPAGTVGAVVESTSVAFPGSQTDEIARLPLNLTTVTTFPRLVTIEAFAIDAAGNRGLSTSSGTPVPGTGTAATDTVTIVAGRTISLPSGGRIADAIYHRGRNELYLSNLDLNRIEVFQVGTSSFVAGGIPVGSRPFGLALWPRDTLGAYADTLIVANSGGTNLSIVDVRLGARREVRRHRLPNYLIRKIKTAVDPNNGTIVLNITEFDYSDRPLYVATVCRVVVVTTCTRVAAVYSTAPTPAQSTPERGYVAWEELNPAAAARSHFFWEPATGSASLATDTLEVIALRDTSPGQPIRDTLLGGAVGQFADFTQLVFQDTTFVRNSGDFNHVLVGEGGGEVAFARALTFDARAGITTINGTSCGSIVGAVLKCSGEEDDGISQGIFVRDFISNRSSRVRSVATNFNGRTNLVRADSIYVFDYTLRQTGLMQVGGTNVGMDLHPLHAFDAGVQGSSGNGGNGDPDERLIYAARPDANIEVIDTYFYGTVATVPIRDPVTGPIRLGRNLAGQQVLVAVTQAGVVVVPLTAPIANLFPVRLNAVAGPARRR